MPSSSAMDFYLCTNHPCLFCCGAPCARQQQLCCPQCGAPLRLVQFARQETVDTSIPDRDLPPVAVPAPRAVALP